MYKLYWRFVKALLEENFGIGWEHFIPNYNDYRKNWIAVHVDMGEEADVIRKFFPQWSKFYDWKGETEDVMVDDFSREFETFYLVSGVCMYWVIRKK